MEENQKPAEIDIQSTNFINESILVSKDSTLWSIASNYISQNEHLSMKDIKDVMTQIQTENPKAFIDGEVDKLKEGAKIELPKNIETNADVASDKPPVEQENNPDNQIADTQKEDVADPASDPKDEQGVGESDNQDLNETEIVETTPDVKIPQEGVASDVVADKVESTQPSAIESVSEESSEQGFFAKNWVWIGAAAGAGVAFASKSDDEPVPTPTLDISDGNVNVAESSFTLSGTADKNATVSITVGNLTKNATSDNDGNYTLTFTADDIAIAGQGSLNITVVSNRNDKRVSESISGSIEIDTISPEAPVINAIAIDDVINASELNSIITGTAEAGSQITLSIADTQYTIVVSDTGTWSYTLTEDDVSDG